MTGNERANDAPEEHAEATGDDPSAADQTLVSGGPADPDIEDLLAKLNALESVVDDDVERRTVKQTIAMVERMPGSKAFTTRISKYTTRDVAESFVGAVIFSLPLLVEDGVFDIAEFLVATTVGPVPIFLVANVAFVVVMTAGLLYYADFRDVRIENPIFGVVPGRLVAVLGISFLVAFSLMFMWGRLHEGDPTTVERFGRVTVIWAAAAFGAGLGDILPGESTGRRIGDRIDDVGESLRDD
ncbi:hypothetical protein JCM18237_03120 [Halorubrum luteum]